MSQIWKLIAVGVISGILNECASDIICYDCAFATAGPKKDAEPCLPQKFDSRVLQTTKCQKGCIISIMYEKATEAEGLTMGGSNAMIQTNVTDDFKGDLSMYTRTCSKKLVTREGCEKKVFSNVFYHIECSCNRNYCNGEINGTTAIHLSNLLLFLLLSNHFLNSYAQITNSNIP